MKNKLTITKKYEGFLGEVTYVRRGGSQWVARFKTASGSYRNVVFNSLPNETVCTFFNRCENYLLGEANYVRTIVMPALHDYEVNSKKLFLNLNLN